MTTRGVGLLLVLTAAIAIGALAQHYRFDALIASEHATGRAIDSQIHDLDLSVAALQRAQQALVAQGQLPGDWLDRAARLKGDIEAAIASQRASSQDAEIVSALDAAADALKALNKTDAQARALLQQNDRPRAADLIFADGAGAVGKMHESLAAAVARNRRLTDDNVRRFARLQLALNGIAILFVLAVAVYLGRAVTLLSQKAEPSTAQMLRDLPPPVKAGPAPAAAATVTPAHAAGPAPAAGAAAQPHRSSSLSAAAELCVDLARVLDADDVPVLLERTASVLDARGIVFWAVDADGARLRPSLSHGYSERVLVKLRPLQIDSDNVTALAYRSLQPQMINGATTSDSAALAIPLMTGTGCVGVMAVELRHNRPHADLLATARILGAQFSTLIAPPEDEGRRTAQASS